jgi:hypothetical protein
MRTIGCLCALVLLFGCDTDDFVIAGETDGCSSSGGAEEHALDEPVIDPPLAERQHDDLELSRPTRAPVQERR